VRDVGVLLKEAIAAVQTGDLEVGRRLLNQVLEEDPQNEQAWLWMSAVVDDVEERKACLRRVLQINCYNEEAWRSLKALTIPPSAPRAPEEQPTLVEGQEFACPGCGSDLRYSPGHEALLCPECGKVVDIPPDPGPPSSFPLVGAPATPEAQKEWIGRHAYRCRSCGATTAFSSRWATLECPFCGSSVVVQQPVDIPLIPPQAIVPFRLEWEQASQAFRHALERGWLQPGDLASQAAVERLHGVYIPFWLFDGMALAQWDDERGSRQNVTRVFLDVPVCASLSLTDELVRELWPFEFEALKRYRPEYIAGWPVEVYQIALADASVTVRAQVREEAEADLGALDQVNVVDLFWKLALLPVYLGTYRYQGRTYLFAVNGQTGKVYREAPRSRQRVAAFLTVAVLLIVLLLFALAWLWMHPP
jgi:predicted RNA-binding Zn-ribbon protein involved in translation (DUF1610 family)